MGYSFKGVALLAALMVLGISGSPALAAKGVKKSHEHHFKGIVIAVQHGNKGAPGTLTVRVTHQKHKKGANVAGQSGTTRTFTINRHTHVHVHHANRRHGLAALRPGERVSILAHHHHADRIDILHHHKTLAKVGKV